MSAFVIFLDFDGVLHSTGRDSELFSRVAFLWQILRARPDIEVVFSTSWREVYQPDEMVEFVTHGGGEDLAQRFLGRTLSIKVEGPCDRRDLEIQRWLDVNEYSGPWLAIDDMPELFNGGHPNLYVVDGETGLTDADVLALTRRIIEAAHFE